MTPPTRTKKDVQRLIEILRTREREGEGSRFDRLRAEHELREAHLAATAASIEVTDARARLAAMLPVSFTIGRITWSAAPRPIPAVDTLMTRAASSRADLRALDRSAERVELESAAARRVRTPPPVLLGGLKRSDGPSGRETGGVFGVSFTLPVFDAGDREAGRWSAERERISADRVALEQLIRTEIVRAAAALDPPASRAG